VALRQKRPQLKPRRKEIATLKTFALTEHETEIVFLALQELHDDMQDVIEEEDFDEIVTLDVALHVRGKSLDLMRRFDNGEN
jgi:serine/threonine protein kinase HipA of HipAB toxin-antitoxin module